LSKIGFLSQKLAPDVLESQSMAELFSSSTGWRVMVLQNSAKEVAPAGPAGFQY